MSIDVKTRLMKLRFWGGIGRGGYVFVNYAWPVLA